MHRLVGCLLLLGASLAAESLQSTLLALKDSQAPRKTLSDQLVDEMMALAKADRSPVRTTVQRFAEDLTSVLLGKDVTAVRAAALEKAIVAVMSGKGSTALPANKLYETLAGFRINDRTIQRIVDRFRDIGQEIRGPDDLGLQPRQFK
jgi:hypothetical protein